MSDIIRSKQEGMIIRPVGDQGSLGRHVPGVAEGTDVTVILTERHRQEQEFHDHEHAEQSFYKLGVTRHIFDRLLERAGDLKGRRVLDLGCGSGWASAIYAQRGALVTGIELSSEALRAARKYIAGKCLDDKVGFYAMPAECLGFPSGIFDCVLGSSVLHHTDLSRSIPEVARVLKPGGSAIFIEPLIHNPVLKLYRWLTPQYRSPSERPLSIEEIRGMDLYFSSVTREDFYLVSLVSFFWSKVIRSDRLLLSWLDALVRVDKWILLWFPWLGRYCWGTLVVLRK